VSTRLQLGAPGIYALPPEPIRQLTGARMDVCAFAGVAPRGPSRRPSLDGAADWIARPCDGDAARWPRTVAVPVDSFDAYRRLYAGFEGPGLLPYAVASFFENGGLRAFVVRAVPSYGGDDSKAKVARGGFSRLRPASEIPPPPAPDPGAPPLASRAGSLARLRARDEGAWGNRVAGELSFQAKPFAFQSSTLTSLLIASDVPPPAGSLLRVSYATGLVALRFAREFRDEWRTDPASPGRPYRQRLLDLESALPAALVDASDARVDLIEGTLLLDDGDGRVETLGELGLSSSHPRWLARVVYEESSLAWPEPDGATSWYLEDLDVAGDLVPYSVALAGGADDYAAIIPEDFFDPEWQPSDGCPGDGLQCLAAAPEVASICVPDLYAPFPLVDTRAAPSPARCGATFDRALPRPPPAQPPMAQLDGLTLDPIQDLEGIIGYQQAVVDFAEAIQAIALLDVPPRLDLARMLRWRGRFGSAYAAAYHPWLEVSRLDDPRDALVRVPPSAIAAGIIAQRELALGIPHGPANVVANGAVDVVDVVSPAAHAALHPLGINVYLRERDGVRLTAARTLSRDPAYRQLSVRRLVTMLRRTLDQQMQWSVFEPNGAPLRRDLRRMIGAYLGELFRLDAFAGATEEESFFVRCDEALNPQRVIDAGQLVCEVGVAPAEPLEFIVLRVERGGDGTIRVEG
jgi:hypothetical protein